MKLIKNVLLKYFLDFFAEKKMNGKFSINIYKKKRLPSEKTCRRSKLIFLQFWRRFHFHFASKKMGNFITPSLKLIPQTLVIVLPTCKSGSIEQGFWSQFWVYRKKGITVSVIHIWVLFHKNKRRFKERFSTGILLLI